jgi:prepilin-type N-terminal cleavage/methylation domain-containing protein
MLSIDRSRRSRERPATSSRGRRGITLIEMLMVVTVLTVAMSMLVRTLVSAAKLEPVLDENETAAEAARSQIEAMRNHPFAEVFARYDDDILDDPGGPGSAPGSRFHVPELEPLAPGGFVGHVEFPTIEGQLREDVNDDSLTMPRDLNGDGVVDSLNHAGDRILLPVKVVVEWKPAGSQTGPGARRKLVFYTMFSEL